ncbi:MAG TPA: diversity-generating retroelement protein Avd [Saprospiraceae bacterium]|nr:diversity-generating retroelement protein Avd [Saprospiraceae bacterium]HNL38734.1 diversity-generating retroelement protein Avd [Saprospiraceae bacterium]HNM26253.1 diversity-generating retroelement protein Avd [Saprospiraceae bacterium]
MDTTKETLVAKAYDLLKYSLPVLERLPKSQKFTLGDRVQNHLSDLLEMLLEAYYLPAPDKRPLLYRVNLKLEVLRHFYRLAYERGHYNSLVYKDFSQRVDEIGRMVGGWLKSLPK